MVLSIIATAVVLMADSNMPEQYKYLYLLPLGHIVLSIIPLARRVEGSLTIATLVFYWLYTLRNAFTPLLLPLCNFDSIMTAFGSKQCLNGIFLMLYETLIVYIGCSIITPNYHKVRKLDEESEGVIETNPSKHSIYGFVVLIVFLFFLFGYIRLPQLRDTYYAIWDSSSYFAGERISRDLEGVFSGARLDRNIYVICKYIQKYLIFVISIWVIDKLYAQYDKNGNYLWLFLTLLIIPAQFVFMSDANLASFIAAFCLLYTILRVYPERKKSIYTFFFATAFAAVILLSVNRFMNVSVSNYSRHKLSAFMQSYIPGVSNFACLYNIKSDEMPSMFQTLLYDFISGLPFKGTFIGSTDYKLSLYYNSYSGARGQILPCVGQFAYYVTEILAPFLCLIYLKIAQTSLAMAEKASTALEIMAYILLFAYSVINPATNNTTNYISLVVQRVLPLFILRYFRRIRI